MRRKAAALPRESGEWRARLTGIVTQGDLINLIIKEEPDAITRTLAMMAFNPAIGRVLKAGSVAQFSSLMVELIPKLYGLPTRDRFEAWHKDACIRIVESFKTRSEGSLSYGQAQKPLNVFLKVYTAWAKQPTVALADSLLPFLHVPLDSVLMKCIAREFPGEYAAKIAPIRRRRIEWTHERVNSLGGQKFSKTLVGSVIGSEFSLTAIDEEIYKAWQDMLRSFWPGAPVRLDTLWAVNRIEGQFLGNPAE
jgi:hypothetical protein